MMTRFARARLGALRWALAAGSLAAATARAQVVRYGVMEDSARAVLRAAWRSDSAQPERAYCVRRARIVARVISPTKVDSIFHVIEVRPAHVEAASPNHVTFACHAGTPELHTHTPATCLGDAPAFCAAGGPEAYSCQPSREDYEKLIRRGDPFAIIQCDRAAFRFYYPSDYAAPAKPHRATGTSPTTRRDTAHTRAATARRSLHDSHSGTPCAHARN